MDRSERQSNANLGSAARDVEDSLGRGGVDGLHQLPNETVCHWSLSGTDKSDLFTSLGANQEKESDSPHVDMF